MTDRVGKELHRIAQAALVEGMRVLRALDAHVDAPREAAGPGAGEVTHVRDEARRRVDRARAAHGDEQIAARHRGADLVHSFRELSSPDKSGSETCCAT